MWIKILICTMWRWAHGEFRAAVRREETQADGDTSTSAVTVSRSEKWELSLFHLWTPVSLRVRAHTLLASPGALHCLVSWFVPQCTGAFLLCHTLLHPGEEDETLGGHHQTRRCDWKQWSLISGKWGSMHGANHSLFFPPFPVPSMQTLRAAWGSLLYHSVVCQSEL